MIYFDPTLTVAEAAHAAKILGCKLIQDRRGNVKITPVGCIRNMHRNNVTNIRQPAPPVDYPKEVV